MESFGFGEIGSEQRESLGSTGKEQELNLLNAEALTIAFGGIYALKKVNLSIKRGELRALIGPNGAGKTTLFNVITGFYRPESGSIYFEGKDISDLKIHERACRGIVRTFQKSEMFGRMTVLDNIMVGKHIRLRAGLIGSVMRFPRVRVEEDEKRRESCDILEFLGLAKYKNHLASSLSFGLRRLVELGRALAANPNLLLLDEPSAGMNSDEIANLHRLIQEVRRTKGITILMVEHNMRLVMGIADKISVLHYGEKIADGGTDQIRKNPKVIEAYLGSEE
jgi:branched-chain amino acid transport system ATP-binding protein